MQSNTNNQKQEIEQLLKKGSGKQYVWGVVFLIAAFLLFGDAITRIWRMPWGLGLGILALVLAPWALRAWWRTMRQNAAYKKQLKDIAKKM